MQQKQELTAASELRIEDWIEHVHRLRGSLRSLSRCIDSIPTTDARRRIRDLECELAELADKIDASGSMLDGLKTAAGPGDDGRQ